MDGARRFYGESVSSPSGVAQFSKRFAKRNDISSLPQVRPKTGKLPAQRDEPDDDAATPGAGGEQLGGGTWVCPRCKTENGEVETECE
eukprot:1178227-Prorocentrum_minimum.AAC.1